MALGKNKILWGLLGLIVISVIATGFYINDFTKTNIRESLIDEKSEIQMIMTKKSCSICQFRVSETFDRYENYFRIYTSSTKSDK